MTLKNLGPAVFLIVEELSHVPFTIADMCKPFRAFGEDVSFSFGFQRRGFLFESAVKQLLRSVRSVNRLRCFQYVQRELVAIGLKKIIRKERETINHFWFVHFLRYATGYQISVAI